MIKHLLLQLTMLITFNLSLFAQVKISNSLSTKSTETNEIKLVSIGSSLSGGVRDGGVYPESQVGSFPNLIAKQMGVSDFKQPILQSLNGSGYFKTTVDANGEVSFVSVARDKEYSVKGDKVNHSIDNLSIPYLKVMHLASPENESGTILPLFEKKGFEYFNRLFSSEKESTTSYISYIKNNVGKVDFFTIELGLNDFVSYYLDGAYGQSISFMTYDREGVFPENEIIQFLTSKGGKGAIANVPDINLLPYFRIYTYENLVKSKGEEVYIQRYHKNNVRRIHKGDLLLPTTNVKNLFSSKGEIGLSEQLPLLDEEVIGVEELVKVDHYNRYVSSLAGHNKIPLVDLRNLYDLVLKGEYISHDGVKIDPSYPQGNFFSSDGIHPSSVGQAVIANEFIKSINAFYKTDFKLISMKNITTR